ncbi:hypothetical protein EBBID32_45270 [Sphingobium indicum BiD32]|uniref:Tip attachment protein J domain-containing protein n=1 Tax=Sphingobium indicum BiD32 TaxID=1301087 RepID=N1MT63_9SPHN|nr:phage tail protein [Sphingobium indicum]CCW20156.1 hypothetical protein EBBID32_45270 [Sphingobium indicum BiD32]
MSKTLRTVAVIAGAVALVAATGGAALAALAPAGMAGTATLAGVSAATLATVATVASVASTLASIGAQLMAKKPPARGTINQVIIAAEPVSPYIIGRTYSGGVLRHDVGYGATLKKVKNPYRGMVLVYSVAGPLLGLEACYMDYAVVPFSGNAATGYYSSFLYRDVRSGLLSETALTPHFAGMPNWSSAHKLSSKAAILWNGKFDKDGKRFASGWPTSGAVWEGVMTYDARQDSTYPGGSGAHRIADETTWAYSQCPGQHALAYVLGRFRNGKKVFGVGLPPDGIIVQDFVTLSNICDANGWTVGGVVYEPGDRWANLKRILEAGAAEPMWRGGKLGLRFNAPRLSLYTLTADDLADEDVDATAQQTWAARLNGIRPKYRSEANKWEYVQSDLVSIASYLTEDGEEKIEEQQYDLIQQKDQAAQIAAYKLLNSRELAPIVVPCKPHMRHFGPGDMLTLDLPDHGLGGIDAIILKRQIDPARMVVTFTFMSESAGKHDFALGRTGTAPPTPALTTGEDRDDIATEIVRGADGFSVAPSSWVRAISCTYAGTPKSGQFPLTATYYVYQGAEEISEDVLTTYSLATTNCVAALGGTNDRVLTIDTMSADRASAEVTISYDGTVVSVASINLTKVRDGGSVNTATDSTLSVNSSGTYAGVSGGPLTLNVGPDGLILVDMNLNYGASSGTGALAGKIQYRTTPGSGSWTDMAAEESDPYGATVGEPSTLTLSTSIAGPSSAADWEFQLLTRRSSGTGTLVALDGAMTVGWS